MSNLSNRKLLKGVSGIAVAAALVATPQLASAGSIVDEILVTATKRETTIQDAPISVAVVSGEMLDNYNIIDLNDLQSFVPNLTVQKTFGNLAVRVRGLGSGVTNIAFDSSVSIFNDGIYCGRSRCLEMGFLDVGGVEIARGPQGALFGKSTIAGAIAVKSARPTSEFEGYITTGLETENGGHYLKTAFSGPLSDTFRVRVAALYEDMDGDMQNTFLDTEDNGREASAIRGSFEWDISDDVELFVKAETGDFETDGNRQQLIKLLSAPVTLARLTAAGVAASSYPEENYDGNKHSSTGVGREEYDYSDQSSFTAELTADIWNGHKLQITAGFWEFDSENNVDIDGLPEFLINTQIFESYSQDSIEAKIVSPASDTFEYIIGALYHQSDTYTRQFSPFAGGFYATVAAPNFVAANIAAQKIPAGTKAIGGDRQFYRDSDTMSVFGQLTYHVTDRLAVTADVRYTEEEQDGRGTHDHLYFADGYTPTVASTPLTAIANEYTLLQTREDDSLDPSIRVLYELNDTTNVYVAYSEGSKPGGLKANDGNLGKQLLAAAAADATFLPAYAGVSSLSAAELKQGVTLQQGNAVFDFEDEEAESWEIGAKMLLDGGNAMLNTAVFSTEYTNLQTSSYDGSQAAFIIGNAGSAEIEGIEFELMWNLSDQLSVNASGALISAEYKEFLGAKCPRKMDDTLEDPTCTSGDLSGRRLDRSPEEEFNIGLSYNTMISPTLKLIANADAYYSGDYFGQQDFDPQTYQEDYWKYNARIGLATESNWYLTLIGRNLGDERTIEHAYKVNTEVAGVSAGRSVTLELTKRF